MVARIIENLRALKAMLRKWRAPLTIAAAAIFFAGLYISLRALDLDPQDLSLQPILLILFVFTPVSLLLAAANLQLTARAIEKRIDFWDAFSLSAFSRIAELLPLPSGAMVKGAALMRAGAGLTESAVVVSLTALLTLLMSIAIGSLPVIAGGYVLGYVLLVIAAAAAALIAWKIATEAGASLAAQMIGLRFVILFVKICRISVAFAAIGVALGLFESALFVISATLGSAASIAPAGLGVSELLAAALADFVRVAPAAAFLAFALNRIVGLSACGVIVLAAISKKRMHRSVE